MPENPIARASKLALALLRGGPTSPEEVAENCDDVLAMLRGRGEEVPDRDALIREIQGLVVIWQPRSTSLEDRTGHEGWLVEKRPGIEWRFWDRYRVYLEQVELLPPAVISRLDDSTDRVLSKLEWPGRLGEWDRRGLVVGQVQSGKTGHYTGLACKAADAGYKLIVVLAGMHNSLRSQTQLRLDEGLLGFDTQYQNRYDDQAQARIGVGAMKGLDRLKINSLTSSHDKGDFRKSHAQNMVNVIGDIPYLLVVKKHGGILKNLHSWVTQMHGQPVSSDSDELIVSDIPLLIIDDEADNASVNTKNRDEEPAMINRRLRELLKAFDKSAYVGYTATPYANIYSSPDEDIKFGLDLFPRHFIESLKPPSNYFGPTRVFGLKAEDEEPATVPLPIFRSVTDYQDWLPDRHRKSWKPEPQCFPPSLRKAVLSFFLVCAARRARSQDAKHNSMLVHTTRFQDVQQEVSNQVADLVTTSRYRLRYGDGDGENLLGEIRAMWQSDFATTSRAWDRDVDAVSWDDVYKNLMPAIDKIEVRTINGTSSDALTYYENRKAGLSVIAIGGDKLSRGLTLDGLSVSYYLRATRMYDTLMQMGRWFGYRPGYEDLCRLYTTPLLHDWYREITAASDELRSDFDEMASLLAQPEEFGLRVRQSEAGLSVTSPTKMRTAASIQLTFSGDISESVTFNVADQALRQNREALSHLVGQLISDNGRPTEAGAGNYKWEHVDGATVGEFFDSYQADRMAKRARPQLLSRYIRDAMEVDELTDWTVMLVSSSASVGNPDTSLTIEGLNVGLTVRSPLDDTVADIRKNGRYRIRRVLSPVDESIDLTQEQARVALDELTAAVVTKAGDEGAEPTLPKAPSGIHLRRQRPSRKGLLLLYVLDDHVKADEESAERARFAAEPPVGFAVSFPISAKKVKTRYQVNEIWFRQAFEDFDDDDE